MNRFQTALRMADDNPDFKGVVERLLKAIQEVEAEGARPEADPAVMLFGARVAFLTHADMATDHMYRQLIDVCEARARISVAGQFGVKQ